MANTSNAKTIVINVYLFQVNNVSGERIIILVYRELSNCLLIKSFLTGQIVEYFGKTKKSCDKSIFSKIKFRAKWLTKDY